MTEQGTSYAFRGVVTQITATLRLRSGWSGQYSLFDFSCKLSPFRAGLLTVSKQFVLFKTIAASISSMIIAFYSE